MIKLLKDLVSFAVGLIEVLLIFRFVLRMLGANPAAEFVAWVYSTSAPLVAPFDFAFPSPAVGSGFVLEFSTLLAIFAYAFLGFVVQRVLEVLDKTST